MRILPVVIAVLLSMQGFGQTLRGTVKDSTAKAVPYASVNLRNSADNRITGYAVTDAVGAYTLQLPLNTPISGLVIEVTSIGYKTQSRPVTDVHLAYDFTLIASVNQLQDIVIKSSRPVLRTHGDTLSYKVADFANAQDRTIGEVIKKLPGITVAADGTISYNNKPISALYIGGDNLLDDKYSIAANSIPQGAVNQVQVIQNDQPIKALRNKVISDDIALNLEIKKGAKLHLMGQESIGLGLPGNYDANLNALMFKDNYKAINYLAGNNTGYDVQQDLVSHNLADYNQRTDNALPPALLSLGGLNTPQLAENRYLFDRSGILNANNLLNLKDNVQLKVNAWYLHDTQTQDYRQQTTVFLPGDTVKYSEVQHNRSVPDIFHAQFTLNINRPDEYLNDALTFDQQNENRTSGLRTDSSVLNQVLQDKALNFSNEFNLIRSLRSNHIIQLYSYVSHSAEPENLAIDPGYNAAVFNKGLPYAGLVQTVNIPSWYTNNYFSYKIPHTLITQSYRAGFSVQSQTLTSGLNVVQNNANSALLSDSARNQLGWIRKKLYAEAAYDLPGDVLKAHLSLPLTLQQIGYADRHLSRLYFNAQLSARYQVSTENYLSGDYSYRNQIGTIENVYPGDILTDYRTLQANTSSLSEQQVQQAGAGFYYRRALRLFFWNINAAYRHTASSTITSSIITNSLQQGIVLPFANSTDSWILGVSVSKYSFALRTTFSGALQWQDNSSVALQNHALLPFHTTTETANINADTKVTDQINLSYKATLTQTSSHSAAATSAGRVDQLLQQLTVNYNPIEALQFKLFGEHYFTRQQGNPDLKYFFADASLKYRAMKWKTDFELSAVNIGNVKTYNALYLSANTLTASSYALPGRIILLKVLFNL